MSLDYDLTRVDGVENLDRGKIEAVIFGTILVGLGEITEENAKQFYSRVYAYECVTGRTLAVMNGEGLPTTPDDIRTLIGLRTNVLNESDARFSRKLLKWASQAAASKWKEEKED